jgi:alkane 1-monooxygenase
MSMRKWRVVKYLAAWILPMLAWVSFTQTGWMTFLPVFFAFVLVPILDQIMGIDSRNLEGADRALAEESKWYDAVLHGTVVLQVVCSIGFLWVMQHSQGSAIENTGRILSMGLMNGVFGINVAHELGHRTKALDRFLAKVLLSTTLFLHFYVEHNKGHHKHVSTPEDPATARFNESIYAFFLRTIPQSYRSAWRISMKELGRRKRNFWSIHNEMLVYTLVHACSLIAIGLAFGTVTVCYFVLAALIGILLLETVNYIEHYGLVRKKVSEHRYEDVQVWHSWNSDFVFGRVVLFELTRHSDHHWQPNKPYALLDSLKESHQMPAGYPAMMLLTFVPPLWFSVMNKRITQAEHSIQ